MNFLKRLFGSRSNTKAATLSPGAVEGVMRVANQHREKMAVLDREEDEYWDRKKAELQAERAARTASDASAGTPPNLDETKGRAAGLAKIAEWHFKCERFDEARKNYERAALLTVDDDNLSRRYRQEAEKAARKAR